MGYFLCLKKCFKKCLLYRGYVLEDTAGKYLIPLEIQSKPEGEIQTFVNGSAILANNVEYNFKGRLIETDYQGVYKTGTKFFTIQQKGQRATLSSVSVDEAREIWNRMPRKVVVNPNVFCDPREVKKRNIKDILLQAEETRPQREYEERVREIKKQPYWWLEHPEFAEDIIDFN